MTGDRILVGLTDSPIHAETDEALGLRAHAEALAEFVRGCQTPMTIALQGDWGSGKTSLMNLIRNLLAGDAATGRIKTVWFNTWQFSQFEMADTLAASLMSQLVREIVDDAPPHSDDRKAAARTLRTILKVGTRITLAALNRTELAKAIEQSATDLAAGSGGAPSERHEAAELDRAAELRQLKDGLAGLVREAVGHDGQRRLVIFVDDLDRLVPARAVELLECLKLFLDLEGCVFVLACDYGVIRQGLRQKFGLDEAELGRSFFDKLIQVPFQMPVGQYRVDGYLGRLLDSIGMEHDDEDVARYAQLVRTSVGFNPRDVKRLFNTLYLLRLIARKRLSRQHSVSVAENEETRVLFAVLCLQRAFEPVYSFLQEQVVSDELIGDLARLRPDSAAGASVETGREAAAMRRLVEALVRTGGDGSLERLATFLDAFKDAIQLRSDTRPDGRMSISADEARLVKEMLGFSAVVSTGDGEGAADPVRRDENRWMGRNVAERVNGALRPHADGLELPAELLSSYQGRTTENVTLWTELPFGTRQYRVEIDFRPGWCGAYIRGMGRGGGASAGTAILRGAWAPGGATDDTLRAFAQAFPDAVPDPSDQQGWILLERRALHEDGEYSAREAEFQQLVESVMMRLLRLVREQRARGCSAEGFD